MKSPSIAVVILNYNGQKYLEQFLPGVIQNSPGANVIVADNASTDDSINFLTKEFPETELIVLDKNYGFSGGYNKALAQAEADYFILLNSDVEVTEGWLSPMIEFMETSPEYGACQPKIKAFHKKDQFEYAGAAGGFIDKLGYPFCRGRIFDEAENDTGQYDEPTDIFWATGACLMIRSDLYHELGGLDDDFFAHMEEIDLCWRLHHAKKKIICLPQSTVYHVGGGTLQKENPFKTYLNHRNGLFLLLKNLPSKVKRTIFLRLVLDGLSGVLYLMRGQPKNCWAVVRSHFAFYGMYGLMKSKRKRFQKNHDLLMPEKLVLKSPLVQEYFLRKKRVFTDLNMTSNKK